MNKSDNNRNIISSAKPKSILFVDDEQVCHHMMGLIIPNFTHYKLINAYSGTEAIKLAATRSDEICLVLSDILMQDMNGYDIYKHFQTDEKLKLIPFIFQSGIAFDEESLKKEFENEKISFISKPFKHAEILATISKILKEPIRDFRESVNLIL